MFSDSCEISILTLNCWGLGLGISKNRNERMEDIGKYLSEQNYDVVLLQEVWIRENFNTIRSLLASMLPYSHFFDNGIIGTGTCIFSKVRINDVTFHEFGLNGYPHKLAHGDWFGGKGLGVGQIDFKGFNVHLFTSHYHATYDYNPLKDVYLGHRVVHAVESAQWIKLSSSSADLTIYAGDLNTEPKDIPYQLVRYVTPLKDSWVEGNGVEGGETSETPANSFTYSSALRESPQGKRIDYILYMAGPNITARTVSCSLPLPHRIAGKNISYSDHEAVATTIKLSRQSENRMSIRDFVRSQSCKELDRKREVVAKGKEILLKSIRKTSSEKLLYLLVSCFLLLLLLLTFFPLPASTPFSLLILADVCFFLVRLGLIITMSYLLLMATLFLKKERHALRSTLSTLDCILDNHTETELASHINFNQSEKEMVAANGQSPLSEQTSVQSEAEIAYSRTNKPLPAIGGKEQVHFAVDVDGE